MSESRYVQYVLQKYQDEHNYYCSLSSKSSEDILMENFCQSVIEKLEKDKNTEINKTIQTEQECFFSTFGPNSLPKIEKESEKVKSLREYYSLDLEKASKYSFQQITGIKQFHNILEEKTEKRENEKESNWTMEQIDNFPVYSQNGKILYQKDIEKAEEYGFNIPQNGKISEKEFSQIYNFVNAKKI